MTNKPTTDQSDTADGTLLSRAVLGVYSLRNTARLKLLRACPDITPRNLSRARVGVFIAYIGATFLTYPAAAQFQEVGSQMCESGLGDVIAVVFSLLAIYFIFKTVFRVMGGLDKHKSPKPGEHEEGVEQLESAGSTFLAALVPVLAAIFFELIGLNTFSCLEFDIGILG